RDQRAEVVDRAGDGAGVELREVGDGGGRRRREPVLVDRQRKVLDPARGQVFADVGRRLGTEVRRRRVGTVRLHVVQVGKEPQPGFALYPGEEDLVYDPSVDLVPRLLVAG